MNRKHFALALSAAVAAIWKDVLGIAVKEGTPRGTVKMFKVPGLMEVGSDDLNN